ncbi:MAG: hypothetical protein ACTSQE_07740 [Candidatus Heimdallarchaeaceae archaeon]
MLQKNLYDQWGKEAYIDREAFVHKTAVLIGNIHVSRGVFIGPYVVIRADEEDPTYTLEIGENTNIQDHVLIHASNNKIGREVTIAHGAKVHGSVLKDNSILYIGACADRAIIEEGAFIHAHSYVGEGVRIPANKLVPPGSCILTQQEANELMDVPNQLNELRKEIVKRNIAHCKQYLSKRYWY